MMLKAQSHHLVFMDGITWGMSKREKCEDAEEEEEWNTPRELMKTISFSESLWIIYTRITEPKYTIDAWERMGERNDMIIYWPSFTLHPHLSRPDLTIPEDGEEWVRQGGRERDEDGDEDIKILRVCVVIVSEGEIIVSCTV